MKRVTLNDLVTGGVTLRERAERPDVRFLRLPDRFHKLVKIRRHYKVGEMWIHLELHYKSIADCMSDKQDLTEECGAFNEGAYGPVINPRFGIDPCAADVEETDSQVRRADSGSEQYCPSDRGPS
jgi:hypothetical protein